MGLRNHYFCALATIAFHLVIGALSEETETGGQLNNNDTSKKPNIVIILADDVGTGDLPFFWGKQSSQKVQMPNLQKLAQKGVLFKDAHSSPLCAPSRYMLLSGNYPHRGTNAFGSWGVNAGGNQFTANQRSIAETLQIAGYHTGMFGKWHLGAKVPPSGIKNKDMRYVITADGHDWSLPLIEGPGDIGFDESYITLAGIQQTPYSFIRNDILETNLSDVKYWEEGSHQTPLGTSCIKKPGEGDPSWDSSAYDMILVNETSKFIDTHLASAESSKPFFAYVALGAVHIPHSPPNKYLDGSQVLNVYETRHLDMLGAMDKAVGSVVSMIEDKDLSKETIIIFTSDNGGLGRSKEAGHRTSGPLRGTKGNIWEGGHRVPLIIRYDNKFPAGKKRNRFVGLNDIYSTICELVGVDVPQGSAQDSVSFANYITNWKNKAGLRKYLGTWQLNSNTLKSNTYWKHAIRKGILKLIHYPHNNTFLAYNMKKDFSETENVIHKPWVAKRIQAMYEKLMELGPCNENDRSDSFFVSGLGEDRNCEWFRQNKKNRCAPHFEGELSCPSICGRFNQKCSENNMYGNWMNLKKVLEDA